MQRILANVGGMMSYLSHVGVRLKDFGAFVERILGTVTYYWRK